MLQYSEVKPQYTLSSKVKVGFTVSTLHVQDTGWSEIMQGGAKGEVTRHHLKEKAVKYKQMSKVSSTCLNCWNNIPNNDAF